MVRTYNRRLAQTERSERTRPRGEKTRIHGGPVSEVAPAPRPSAAFGRPAGPGPRPGLASLPGRGPGTAGGAIGLHPAGALVAHRSGGTGAAGGARSPRSQPGYLPLLF